MIQLKKIITLHTKINEKSNKNDISVFYNFKIIIRKVDISKNAFEKRGRTCTLLNRVKNPLLSIA